jgi:hypothetical protein
VSGYIRETSYKPFGDTDIRGHAAEILALRKMDWNSTEGMPRYPLTLSFAKKGGQFMAELPDRQLPNLVSILHVREASVAQ